MWREMKKLSNVLKSNVEAWLLIYLTEETLRISSSFSTHTDSDLFHLGFSLNDPAQ